VSATSYFENLVLDAILGSGRGADIPATVYVGLFTSAPDDGGNGDEVPSTGTGYARVAVANTDDNWPDAASGTKVAAVKIQFPLVVSSWGDLSHFGIFDSATGGNLLVYGEIATPTAPDVGNAPFFAAFTLAVTCD
jgi:hypothetical protein